MKIMDFLNLSGHIDATAAQNSIRNNIYFRGPNAWILAFSIVIASVGLNVNSIPVIIGAMLISPLMGPIFAIGFSLGISDMKLLKEALKNLLIMMGIALLASFLYFLITPLSLNNPTELLARTNPTIYDVLIALFGGSAGIFELCRKEKGTVFSGVAIATALMPPLCTAGYGLACFNFQYFIGAMYLFFINCVFIAIATYLATKLLRFESVEFINEKNKKKTQWIMGIITLIFVIPSIWSAVLLVRENNFDSRAMDFMNEVKNIKNTLAYDHKISHEDGNSLEVFFAGEKLDEEQLAEIMELAESKGIKEDELIITERTGSNQESITEVVSAIYARKDEEIKKKEQEIIKLEQQIQNNSKKIPYGQIGKEIKSIQPNIKSISISTGASVGLDSLNVKEKTIVIVESDDEWTEEIKSSFIEWLKVRLDINEIELITK